MQDFELKCSGAWCSGAWSSEGFPPTGALLRMFGALEQLQLPPTHWPAGTDQCCCACCMQA